MKITVSRAKFTMRADQFLKQYTGYAHIHDRHSDHDSYVRRLSRDHYPRFHIYIKELNDRIIFDLHLDQKKTSYGGSHMHNAEYDGQTVENEVARLKSLIINLVDGSSGFSATNINQEETIDRIPKKDFPQVKSNQKSFWKKFLPF